MEFRMNDLVAANADVSASQPKKVGIGTSILMCFLLPGGVLVGSSASAQLAFTTYQYGTSPITTVTGIRADNMTGNYAIPNTGGGTGGLLFTLSTGNIAPFPSSTSGGANFPGAISSTPYGPSFGSASGILRVGGSYKTTASNPYDLGYLYDGAAAPGAQLTTLVYPGSGTLNTLAHSTFGNQVVGNYDTILATGNAFIYDIPSGTFTTNNHPGAVSTTAYGVYGNRIAGGFADPTLHGYIYNQDTATFTTYNAPGAVVTHFEGITGAGRANTFNLVADSVDILGNPHAWAVHVDAAGIATWTEIAVPGAEVTTANSIYQNKLIGV
jgi:subtilase-type serine protease